MKRKLKIRINGWLHTITIDIESNGVKLTDKQIDNAISAMLKNLNAELD